MQRIGRMIGVAAVALGVDVATVDCSTSPGTSVGAATAVPGGPETAMMTVASYPPPPKRAEIPPPASSPQALWRSSYWSWNGVTYVWIREHCVQRPSPTANWIPGYWVQRPEGLDVGRRSMDLLNPARPQSARS
jgi:hypothetical protein